MCHHAWLRVNLLKFKAHILLKKKNQSLERLTDSQLTMAERAYNLDLPNARQKNSSVPPPITDSLAVLQDGVLENPAFAPGLLLYGLTSPLLSLPCSTICLASFFRSFKDITVASLLEASLISSQLWLSIPTEPLHASHSTYKSEL